MMIRRTFVRNILRFKYDDKGFAKNSFILQKRYSDSSHENTETNFSLSNTLPLSNVSNTCGLPIIQNNIVSPIACTSILNKPLHYGSSNMFVKTSSFHCKHINNNSVRHYSEFRRFPGDEVLQINTGIFKMMSESVPVEIVQNFMVSMHTYTDLPWWAVIILVTVSARLTVSLPLAFYQQYLGAKIENLQEDLKPFELNLKRNLSMAAEHNKATESEIALEYYQTCKEHWDDTVRRKNCHPAKIPVLSIIQIPLWVSLSIALRNMCYMLPTYNPFVFETFMGLTTGGYGWMMDLTDRDHTFTLPIIFGIVNVLSFSLDRLNPHSQKENMRLVQKFKRNMYKGVIVCLIPVLAFVPSCIALFWTTNYVCILLQRLLLLSPKVRRLARLPKTKSELEYPYRDLYKQLSNAVRFQSLRRKLGLLSSPPKQINKQKAR